MSLGIAVVSGMLAPTGLAVLFVPAFFTALERMRGKPPPHAAASSSEPSPEFDALKGI